MPWSLRLPTVLLAACLGAGCAGSPPAAVAPPPEAAPPAAVEPAEPELPPTLNLERAPRLRLALSDVLRLRIASVVREPEPGVLELELGPGFDTTSSVEHNLRGLHGAYWRNDPMRDEPPVLRLVREGTSVGVYTQRGLELTADYRPMPPAAPVPGPAPTAESGPDLDSRGTGRGPVYLSVGVGGGAADFTCSTCDFEMSTALSGYAAIGFRVAGNLVLAVEGTGWSKRNAGTRGRIYSLMATGIGYVSETAPVFVSIGLGYLGFDRDTPAGTYRADAVGYTGRLGVDLGFGGRLAFSPYAGLVGSFGSPRFELEGSPSSIEAGIRNLQFGAAITLR